MLVSRDLICSQCDSRGASLPAGRVRLSSTSKGKAAAQVWQGKLVVAPAIGQANDVKQVRMLI